LIASRKCTGTGGNSRKASLKTWNTIELTVILYKWCEGRSCEVCLGNVYKDSKSGWVFSEMRVQCEEDEWLRKGVTRMTYLSKGENTLQCVRRSRVLLTNCLDGNADGEVIFKHLLTYYFENGSANQSMSIE
jgi:hypothetical protein